MRHEEIRIAHLTDLHVAASWETILDVCKTLAVSAPVLGGIVFSLEKLASRILPGSRIPRQILLLLTTVITGSAAVAVNEQTRHLLRFILALMINYNRSLSVDRKRLFEDIRARDIDHLVITGDLTNTAREEEFRKIRDELDFYGLASDSVTILPGNHDRIGFPKSVEFESYFPGFENRQPRLVDLGEGVVLAGMDSCLPRDQANIVGRLLLNIRGYLSREQVNVVSELYKNPSFRLVIVAMHHPPHSLDKKSAPLFNHELTVADSSKHTALALRKATNRLVLCGHSHPRIPQLKPVGPLDIAIGTASGLRYNRTISYRIFTILPDNRIQVEEIVIPIYR